MAATPLADKTVIVTGGAGGLGKAIAIACLEAGGKVVVWDINEKLLEQCASEISSKGELLTGKVDVTSEESVAVALKDAIEKFGQVDVFINNAGLMDKFDGAAEVERSMWDRILAVNLTGPMITTKAVLAHYLAKKTPGGTFVNIGSAASARGAAAGVAYTASKHGLVGLTKNTAAFYGKQGVRCNILMPGGMHTNIATAFANGMNMTQFANTQKIMAVEPPMCDTSKIGRLCVFLGSDAASDINGATIAVDGGWASY